MRPWSRDVKLGVATVIMAIGIALPWTVSAQANDDCLMCHSDPDLTGEKGGHEVSMFVNGDTFAASVHADFACIDCHMDLDGVELPHAEKLEAVDCTMCHDDVGAEMIAGPHGSWAPEPGSPSAGCISCHGVHDVLAGSDPASPIHRANSTALCARCHDDSLDMVKRSPHGKARGDGAPGAACVDCHRGHAVKAPKDPIGQLSACGTCHRDQERAHRRSLHGNAAVKGDPLAPSCVTCHEHHAILPHTNPNAPTTVTNIPLLCGQCHREGSEVSLQHDIPQHRILENFSMSVHGEGLFEKGLTVTAVCTSCHTSHDILDHNHPESSINRARVAQTCMQCHARIEEVHVKVVEGRLWEAEPHKIPSCVECHQPHKIRRRPVTAEGAGTANCMKCHGNPELTAVRDGVEVSVFIDEEAYGFSSHNQTACAQCHTEVNPEHKERSCATITKPVDCSICHAEQVHEHELSRHGQLAEAGDADVPKCLTCHGEPHAILGHRLPAALTFSRNVPTLCGECHAEGGVADKRIDTDIPDIVASYTHSTHGKGLLESGLVVSASCVDCHGAHRALGPDDPISSVHDDNISDTCGTCHRGIEEQFKQSIHWRDNVVTNEELPTCEDCHTSHTISRTDSGDFRFNMMDQCGRCHEAYAETFFDTYHGKVTQLGSPGAAKCYDCHGTHNILPVTDPESALSTRHVVDTCGQCHPRAHLQFAGYLSHATHHDPERYPFLYWAYVFMTTLLVGTLSFFLLHTFLWLFRLWRTRHHWGPIKENGHAEGRFYLRFSRKQRLMHLVMLLSFFLLALTGMALKFSYMGWAHFVSRLFGGYASMGLLHRVGAVVLMALFLYHIRDMFRAKGESGKTWFQFIFGPNSLMFNLNDITEFWQSTRWFLGRGPRPHYGRFTYWEKFDYFAVFWGVFVIGSTGLFLWFPEFFTRLLPGWAINVATIIHSDEALLAVGFIFTIHFFNTHFRPDKFPMDPVIFTGRVPVDELAHDKPGEFEEFVENATDEERAERVVGPASERFAKTAKIFGFTALGIGLTLIFLIVYSMLFGYR
jgi:cytochrome b subunit of formate dehydrogenase